MYLGRSPSNGWAPHLGVYSERRIDKVWFYIIIIAFDEGKRILTLSPGISFCIPCDRPFATSHSRGTRPPCWRAKIALGQDKQRKLPLQIMYVFCLSCPGATFAPQRGGFAPREWLAAKGLFHGLDAILDWLAHLASISCDHILGHGYGSV